MRTASPSSSGSSGFRPDLDLTDLWPRSGPTVLLAGYGPDGAPVIRVGDGPVACTSARTVCVVAPRSVYDVNGFYARLGVAADATWSQLRTAYLALDGQGDPELTEILMILKDTVSRARYDALLPHERYLSPTMVAEVARQEAIRILRAGVPLSSEFLDESVHFGAENTRKLVPENAESLHTPAGTPCWEYAYYLWGVLATASALRGLPEWQAMIGAALDEQPGPPVLFGVGRSALGSGPSAHLIGDVPVAFLSAGTAPHPQEAQHAASQLRALTS